MNKKVTVLDIQEMKEVGKPISMITAYDFPTAQLVEASGAEMILVGDSLAMVVLGHENTTSITMAEMIHHAKAVSRGAKRPFLVADMPFMSYHTDVWEAVRNAGRFVQEAGMDAVKLEGAGRVIELVQAITGAGIPVVAHLGLTPQRATQLGGFKVQAKTAVAAERLIDDALALEDAGAFALVLEAVPAPVAAAVTAKLSIPTIGIGAGAQTDGQVLVFHDMLGLFAGFKPRFVKQYANLRPSIVDALSSYVDEVRTRAFPTHAHTFKMQRDEAALLLYGEEK